MAFRAFVGLPLPAQAPLPELLDGLEKTGADVKTVPARQLHMTLSFLGNVPDDAAAVLARALDAAVKGRTAFDLPLHGVGAFPNPRNPRVVWVGAKPCPAVDELARRVRHELREAGFTGDDKPFRAHATLGRARSDRGKDALVAFLRAHKDDALPVARVEGVTLYRSTLAPTGSTHEALHVARLEG